jgi:hypothetical protein
VRFLVVEALPRAGQGKLDRQRLLEVANARPSQS